MKLRINKFLSQSGVASRRRADILVKNKKVTINSQNANLGDQVNPENDIVVVDGKIIKSTEKYIYYAVNKPVGYTSTVRDLYAEKTVLDLVPKEPKVYPTGRLDKNSHGLIILTNDGELTNKLTHPKYRHEKEYLIRIQDTRNKIQTNFKSQISKLQKGIRLEEGLAKFDQLEVLEINQEKNTALFRVVLHQGWKRQIRRMCERVGLNVVDLTRTRIGKLKLENIPEGKYQIISREDIN